MSRTDVHRPWLVQIADPHNRHLLYRYGSHRQVVVTSWRNIGCGCKLCTGQQERKQARRSERTAWRTERQRVLALVDHDD